MFKRFREDDNIRLTGWKAWAWKLLLLASTPFRKPAAFTIMVLVLVLFPALEGVAPADIPYWYKDKIAGWFGEISEGGFGDLDTAVERVGQEIAEIAKPVVNRRGFAKSDGKLTGEDILAGEGFSASGDEERIVSKEEELMGRYVRTLKLRYLEHPLRAAGEAVVKNANEIEVGGVYMFLYGIYAAPATEDGKRAEQFLRNYIGGKRVECNIVAYTAQNVATGMCVRGKESVNHLMASEGFSKNVALEM